MFGSSNRRNPFSWKFYRSAFEWMSTRLARSSHSRSFATREQPDPIVPVRGSEAVASDNQGKYRRVGYVSLWVGTFASVEEAEEYFGIPDEIGVYLPAEAFAADFDLGDFPALSLEVNFEQVSPRSLSDLLRDATFAATFAERALEAAREQGIDRGQGVALLYNYDYRLNPLRRDVAGPLRYIGTFAYFQAAASFNLQPIADVAQEIGCSVARVLFVLVVLSDARKMRLGERESGAGHMTAKEYCEYLLNCRGDDTPAILRELGLRRSEEVGRVVFELLKTGLVCRRESESESDFEGLFSLD